MSLKRSFTFIFSVGVIVVSPIKKEIDSIKLTSSMALERQNVLRAMQVTRIVKPNSGV